MIFIDVVFFDLMIIDKVCEFQKGKEVKEEANTLEKKKVERVVEKNMNKNKAVKDGVKQKEKEKAKEKEQREQAKKRVIYYASNFQSFDCYRFFVFFIIPFFVHYSRRKKSVGKRKRRRSRRGRKKNQQKRRGKEKWNQVRVLTRKPHHRKRNCM